MTWPSAAFREDRLDVLHAAIQKLDFGTLVTHAQENFATTYLPFEDDVRLLDLLNRLTERHETGREHRWHVSDAPSDYVREEMRHIVGIELQIESLVGRYKLSQNRDAADREGACAGLAQGPTERERNLAEAIAVAQMRRVGFK